MKQTDRTAVVLGATGLVGSHLVRQLLNDESYCQVVTLARRTLEMEHEKLRAHQVDFEDREQWAALVRGDALFSALGTTLKKAGSKEAQFRIDHDYQLWGMEAARDAGMSAAVLISSTGASATSPVFYSRMKGQLDEAVLGLGIPNTTILRPSFLDGDRKEHRPAEQWGLRVARLLPDWPVLAAARPVQASVVASVALAAVNQGVGTRIWEAREIFARGAG